MSSSNSSSSTVSKSASGACGSFSCSCSCSCSFCSSASSIHVHPISRAMVRSLSGWSLYFSSNRPYRSVRASLSRRNCS
ncbi:MAG: hypothetical protein DME76_08600 [Verrucomicrobia bacterium]|nr:MAG: hypothetical protein DME76_08600 [Verrucomicrobiota bacterium]